MKNLLLITIIALIFSMCGEKEATTNIQVPDGVNVFKYEIYSIGKDPIIHYKLGDESFVIGTTGTKEVDGYSYYYCSDTLHVEDYKKVEFEVWDRFNYGLILIITVNFEDKQRIEDNEHVKYIYRPQ